MGEGYVASWVAFAGLMGGLLASSFTWNWWWDQTISTAPRYWLPTWLGHPGALVVTLAALAGIYVIVVAMEHRAGMVLPRVSPTAPAADSVGSELRSFARTVFVDGWAIIPAGAVLGGLNVLLFTAQEPWGFTGEVSRWSLAAASLAGLSPPPFTRTCHPFNAGFASQYVHVSLVSSFGRNCLYLRRDDADR
jgi:hypothetical protein